MDPSPSDLQLTLTPSEQGTGVCLTLRRPNGADLAAETVSLADCPRLEAEALRPLQDFVDSPLPPDQLKEIGSRLAAILLPPQVRAGLEAEMLCRAEAPVLLRLRVEHAGLASVPWEFAYCGEAESGRVPAVLSGFLGLHPRLHLIRQIETSVTAWDSAAPPSVDTLRVLVISSDPNAPGYPALPHLKAETASVSAALHTPECRGITVTRLDNATPAALARTIRECRPHIVHLIGHGDVRPSGGVLVLQGERDRTAALVYGDELAGWLAGIPVRLVVLSACRTASPGQGLAPSLARAGIPAIVAMQLPLRDSAAGPFARAFYAALAEPQPIEQALAEARRAIAGMGPDWGVPVLYLQTQTGALFAPPAEAAAPAATLPPSNLPYRPSETFVGRGGLLAELHRVLWEEGRSAALVGMGGLGKTQIAVQYAHTQRRAYPGGVFWISGRQIKAELAALASRFFGAPAQWTTEEAADWACDALTQRIEPTLLVCDGFPEDADVRLLPASGACRLLVTTREGYLVRRGFRTFHLPILGDDAAWALLQAHSTAGGLEEVLAVRQIASLLGNLPLALALAAHHVHRLGIGFAAYRNRLQAAPFEALEQARRRFVTGTGHDGTLYDALQLSFQSLTSNARQVLTTATVFAAHGVPTALLGAACGPDSDAELEEAIADLVDSSWVVREEEPRLTLHALIRRFAWERLPETEQSEVTSRVSALLGACLAQARDAGDWQAVRPEMAHCESAARRCRDLSLHTPLRSLLLPLSEYSLTHGELTEARKRCDEGLSLLAQSPASSQVDAAPFLMFRAEVRQQQGEAAEALEDARAALCGALLSATKDDPALIDYYNVLGIILKRTPQSRREAASCFYRALTLSRKAYGRGHKSVAHALNNLGTLYESLNLYKPALRYLSRALTVTRLAADAEVPMVAAYLDNIGRVLGLQAKWAEALPCHQEALSINEAAFTRQHPYVASSLYYLAEAEHSLALPAAAHSHYTEALQLYERFYGVDNFRCGIVRACLARLSAE